MGEYAWPVVLGVLFGLISRIMLLKNDYRQYPTQPHGTIIHLTIGVIAAGLGSIAIPALWEEEYAAITFLALATQQFREVRNMERESLLNIDQMELVTRGKVYIEGIAMVFEGRNYLVIIIAFLTTLATHVVAIWLGLLVGVVGLFFGYMFRSGHFLNDIVDIKEGKVRFEGANVFVDDIHIMNIGLTQSKDIISKQAIGVILSPKTRDSAVTLANIGQRQAILHDMSVGLGLYRDEDTPSLVPLTRLDLDDGRLAVFFIPQIRDMSLVKKVISKVPILENAVRISSESDAKSKF